MSTGFDELLETLAGSDPEIPAARLAELSDLDRDQIAHFARIWQALSEARRRELIRLLGEEAYAHIELNFDEINRISLEDRDPVVRQSAIDNLWESEDPALVAPFLRALTSDSAANVRTSAAAALGQFVLLGEIEQITPALFHEVEEALFAAVESDRSAEVRRAALESLGYSSRPEVSEIIVRAYESTEESDVISSLVAIARSANNEWQTRVRAHLDNPSPDIRLAAVRAAGELELMETVAELVELLEDASEEVRRATIWSLGQLGGDVAKQTLSDLLETSEDVEEVQLVQDALDNLAFVDGTRDLLIFDFDDSDVD